MPNGYTAPIYEGKDISFRDFILHCARGFGFAIDQRDEAGDVPLRIERRKPDTRWHDKALNEAHEMLWHLSETSDDELAEEAKRARLEQLAAWVEGKERAAAMAERYDRMIARVQAWEVPSELEEMKATVLKWLSDSREQDVRVYPDRPGPAETGAERRKRLRKKALDDIAYHERARAEEEDRVDERNRYIGLLVESLDAAEAGAGDRDEAGTKHFSQTTAPSDDGQEGDPA